MSLVNDIEVNLLEEAVGRLSVNGASYGEARFHRVRTLSITVMNGIVIGIGRETKEGFAVRSIVSGGLGFASSSGTSKEALNDATNRALSTARAAAKGTRRKVEMAPARLGRTSYRVSPKRSFEDEPVDVKISRLLEAYKSLELSKDSFKVSSVSIHYLESVDEKVVVTSDGALVESVIPRVAVFYNISAQYEGRRANRWFEIGGSGGLEVLEENKLEELMNDDINSLYINLVKARSPPKGKLDVILSPEVVGLAVHESSGHPSEADRVLGREAAQAGLSFRTYYKGTRIGSRLVTVVDDPTIPGSFGFYLYDDEGVAARPRYLYKDGELAELLHNRETASVYGVESNGAARAMDYRSEPIVRMANTYFMPRDYTFDELLEDVKRGVYIKKYMEWNIDDIRWGQRYVGLEAYLIEDGELKEPVRDVALEVTTREFYTSVDAVGKDLKFYAGTCGKGEPAQGVPVWFGGPHIRLREVRFV
jgi:TldD protein